MTDTPDHSFHIGVGKPDPTMPDMVEIEIVDDGVSHKFWFLPFSARSVAADLRQLAGQLDGDQPPGVVRVPTAKITDWDTFHTVFAEALGFPDFYGRNMNAWIDCLRYADEDDGMRNVKVEPGQVLTLLLEDAGSFADRCPEQYAALVETTARLNLWRIEEGGNPVLSLAFSK